MVSMPTVAAKLHVWVTMLVLTKTVSTASLWPHASPSGFSSAIVGFRVIGPQVSIVSGVASVETCGSLCTARGNDCIAFNWVTSQTSRTSSPVCEHSGWGNQYDVVENSASTYYCKILPRNDSAVHPKIDYMLNTPSQGITLLDGPFSVAFDANVRYLSQLPVDDILFWFRSRAGVANAPNATSWGWDGGMNVDTTPLWYGTPVPGGRNVDGPYGLRGSVAGAFMMGTGGATRWAQLPTLRSRLEEVVKNISLLQASNGFVMAFPMNATNNHELPNYVQSWVTHGLLEAEASGIDGAAQVLRRHFDWFNYATDVLARMLPPYTGPSLPQDCSVEQRDQGHCVYLIYQGIIHNTRLASSGVGTARDIQVAQELYQESWWLQGLANLNQSVVWDRQYAHNYEVTAFEAYLDLYVLTGDTHYLKAMEGAWELMRNYWIHVGGSMAINEGARYPPSSYFLTEHATGELCGSSFWIRFNQRFHKLRPGVEIYTSEIERSLINVILANQAAPDADPPGIRYFAVIEKQKASPTNYVTCCESQGTRTYGALPEFIYSTSVNSSDVYVNLFVPSIYEKPGSGYTLTQQTGFPSNGSVLIVYNGTEKATVHLRIPSWCQETSVPVFVYEDGKLLQSLVGIPGTYLPVAMSGIQTLQTEFPMRLRLSHYNGTSPNGTALCHRVLRAAVEYGPVLLAATYSSDEKCASYVQSLLKASSAAVSINGIDPDEPVNNWLFPAELNGEDTSFIVNGTNGCIVYRPYFKLQTEEFSVYPAFIPDAHDSSKFSTCGIKQEDPMNSNVSICLSCPAGQSISNITNAQFGVLKGNCSSGFDTKNSTCVANSSNVKNAVAAMCVEENICNVPVNYKLYGPDPCPGTFKTLAVSVSCAAQQCDMVTENWPQFSNHVNVGCDNGEIISSIGWAQYGVISGSCHNGFNVSSACYANSTFVEETVGKICIGNQSCAVPISPAQYTQRDPCPGVPKQLAVEINCK